MSAYISKTPYTTAFYSGLLFEYQWQGSMLTYSIPSGTAYFSRNYSDRNEWDSWSALSNVQATVFRDLARQVDSYINLPFIEVSDSTSYGNIRVAYTNAIEGNTLGYAYLPTPRFVNGTEPSAASGDIWLSTQFYNSSAPAGSQLHHVLMHELGHAIGLSHPFEDNAPFPRIQPKYDSFQYTVMSYSDHPKHNNAFPVTFMPLDILALQYLYGVNNNYSPENTTYRFNNQVNIQTIWDPGGYNTLDFSALSSGASIDMREGSFSSVGRVINSYNQSSIGVDNLALAYGTKIHAVEGTHYRDTITGNILDNTINLGGGNDTYIYIGGNDRVYGGQGNNTLVLSGNQNDWLYFDTIPEYDNLQFTGVKSSHLKDYQSIQFMQISQIVFDDALISIEQLRPSKLDAALRDDTPPHLSAILVEDKVITAEEAQLYRIYLGALNRIPDLEGFSWWINQYNQDQTFDHLLIGFYVSDEFRSIADTNRDNHISPEELLQHLYYSVLERTPDETGYNWWLSSIQDMGVQPQQVIYNFTQSEEYIYKTLNTVAEMLWL